MSTIISRRGLLQVGAAAVALTAMGAGSQTLARSPSRGRGLKRELGSRLDPNDIQVLFADLQVGLVADSKTVSPDALSRTTGTLADIATILHMPILFSIVSITGGSADLIPCLRSFSNDINTVHRTPVSPFQDAASLVALRKSGRRTLVISGFAAEAVVLQACVDACSAGYEVYYVVDAIGSQSDRTEAAAFREMERAGAIPTSVLSLSTRLVEDFVHSPGPEVFSALAPVRKL